MAENNETYKPLDGEAHRIATEIWRAGKREQLREEGAMGSAIEINVIDAARMIENYGRRPIGDSPGPFGLLHLGRGTFGQALQALAANKKVSRSGWNGKGMWLRIYFPYSDSQFSITENEGAEGTLLPWIGMKTADNGFVPWLASQTDILSEDWGITE